MKLYDTLTRSPQELKPIKANEVMLYTCGPTVYDKQHIGNITAYIRWDLLTRTLRANGLNVHWLLNITDVGHLVSDGDDGEDKMIKGARKSGTTAWEVAKKYELDYKNQLKMLKIEPTEFIKATNTIQEQIDFVSGLEKLGFTYAIDDGVYFDTSKDPNYGYLARLDIENLKAGARIALNQQKRNITDFALWKFSPKDETRDMEWESPWGKGFPGWHLECSAMIKKVFGDTIDIHAGGIDHIPTHHTGEIAQSENLNGKKLANIWIHGNHMTLEGHKISKSLGNTLYADEIIAQGFKPEVLRLYIFQSKYSTAFDFSMASLEAAKNFYANLERIAYLVHQEYFGEIDSAQFEIFYDDILAKLNDDLNSPAALASTMNSLEKVAALGYKKREDFEMFLLRIDKIFGFRLSTLTDIDSLQKKLITERFAAKTKKDYQNSDRIRNLLKQEGIELLDQSHKTVWYRP